jgi:hypothetical protein
METEEDKEKEMAMEECEESERQETVKEELKLLARRIINNSGIDWDAINRSLHSNTMQFGCEICNGIIEQSHPFSDKKNPGLCDACSELVVRLAPK